VTGIWQANDVTYAPWTFELRQNGTTLAGTVRQSGAVATVATIQGGTIRGNELSFTLARAGGGGTITFSGIRNGETIVFTRTSEVKTGAGDGLFGPVGPARATATRPKAGAVPTANANVLNHKGMTVDVTAIQSAANRDAIVESVRRQIEIVDLAVMKPEQKAFLKSIPVALASGGAADNGNYGGGRVTLSGAVFDRDKPVLLHELMHGYHDKKLADGFRNPGILALYQQARDSQQFPAGSYMLSAPGEYFAMMASVYLHGSAARDPYKRETIKERQPDCYRWLDQEFGPR
jgi:hypothetical protein